MVKSRKVKNIFQSTPSVGRATLDDIATMRDIIISIHALRGEGDHNIQCGYSSNMHFNPRPPWGGRRGEETRGRRGRDISIHALRGEGDANIIKAGIMQSVFQSTPSVGRATEAVTLFLKKDVISIHALRGEGDIHADRKPRASENFNPRPPWGGRQSQGQGRPTK